MKNDQCARVILATLKNRGLYLQRKLETSITICKQTFLLFAIRWLPPMYARKMKMTYLSQALVIEFERFLLSLHHLLRLIRFLYQTISIIAFLSKMLFGQS